MAKQSARNNAQEKRDEIHAHRFRRITKKKWFIPRLRRHAHLFYVFLFLRHEDAAEHRPHHRIVVLKNAAMPCARLVRPWWTWRTGGGCRGKKGLGQGLVFGADIQQGFRERGW